MSPSPVLNVILLTLSIAVLVPIGLFCIECWAAVLVFWRRRPTPKDAGEGGGEGPNAAVLIPAHNEQFVIEQTLDAIFKARKLREKDRVVVVADNCEDQTAELAGRAGAEVVVRFDADHRGKSYAMQSGIKTLRQNPPDVVVMIDADCVAEPHTIETLARRAWMTQRPVQALNLTDRQPAKGPIQSVSLLGNHFTNLIRPLGLTGLGIPCRLTGTGMAIPWRLVDHVELSSGGLVEDMQLGIDLAIQGHMPLFCPEARVTSAMPTADQAFVSQRTRWEHGHLHTAIAQIPPLLASAVRRRSWPLLGIALDLSIPPLTLLVALWLGAAILAGAAWWLGASPLPMRLLAGGGGALLATLGLAWAVFCRRQVPLRTFAAVPWYMLRKLPIYAGFVFRRQRDWVRTERSPE
jgi:cellulose synthase/poly-beta-1,6-N-acetylglucosamine synthase-like glycosyltransferase